MSTLEIRLSKELRDLVESCEDNCVVACCGIDACDFSEKRLQAWMKDKRLEQRAAVLRQIDVVIESLGAPLEGGVGCKDLNAWFSKDEAVEFFSTLKSEYATATESFGKP